MYLIYGTILCQQVGRVLCVLISRNRFFSRIVQLVIHEMEDKRLCVCHVNAILILQSVIPGPVFVR